MAWSLPVVALSAPVPALAASGAPECDGTTLYSATWVVKSTQSTTASATVLPAGGPTLAAQLWTQWSTGSPALNATDGTVVAAATSSRIGGFTSGNFLRLSHTGTTSNGFEAVTFTFSEYVTDISFTITDVDNRDRVSVSMAHTATVGSAVSGTGTAADPWRASTDGTAVGNNSANGNVAVSITEPTKSVTVYLKGTATSSTPDVGISGLTYRRYCPTTTTCTPVLASPIFSKAGGSTSTTFVRGDDTTAALVFNPSGTTSGVTMSMSAVFSGSGTLNGTNSSPADPSLNLTTSLVAGSSTTSGLMFRQTAGSTIASRQTVTFTFDRPVTNLTFTLSDIDADPSYRDVVTIASSIPVSGIIADPTQVEQLADTDPNAGTWRAKRTGGLADTAGDGNVVVSLTGTTSTFTLTYWSDGLTGLQAIFMSGMSFTYTPEIC